MVDMCTSSCPSYSSFSSTLLDSIYRSIDRGDDEMGVYRRANKKDNHSTGKLQRNCMAEKWMEKRMGEEAVNQKKVTGELQGRKSRKYSSFSSSPDSSCGSGFLLRGEDESFRRAPAKAVRTGGYVGFDSNRSVFADQLKQKPKNEGGFLKALRIYGDLKKVKQPLSPGGKLATFLNSLFTAAGNSKKSKTAASSPTSKSAYTSTCSSASPFPRSCPSKSPYYSAKKSPNIAKRSVTFFPASMIGDEDPLPRGHKWSAQQSKPISENRKFEFPKGNNKVAIEDELMAHVMEYNRRVEDAAIDFLRKTHFKNEEFMEDDDDLESCASSDLFELPVYGTSYAEANRAVAL